MLITATVLALSIVGGKPAHARVAPVHLGAPPSTCIAPTRTGTFRLVALSKRGNEPNTAVLMLENIQGCLEVTFVTGGSGPTIIDGISVAGDTLKGTMHMSTGAAKVSFKFSEKAVAGSIVEGRREWTVEGYRTS